MRGPGRLGVVILLLALLLGTAPALADSADNALVEGNRRFRQGDFEGAMQAYAAGYGAGASPVLAYNLGVTAHRLGRLPEAILWYRRAELSMGSDPWLRDNLELARSALGAPERPRPPGARWAERRAVLLLAGTLLAWCAFLLAFRSRSSRAAGVGGSRSLRWSVVLAAVLSILFFAAGTFLGRLGPRSAVLLADCAGLGSAENGGLPAGTEVWVRGQDGGWRVLGEPEAVCPAGAVSLVEAPFSF